MYNVISSPFKILRTEKNKKRFFLNIMSHFSSIKTNLPSQTSDAGDPNPNS